MATGILDNEEYLRKAYKVKGKKVLIFADTHFSCTYEGRHKDYTYECLSNMARIIEIVKEDKPDAVMFLGDLIGVKERNIKDRQFLMRVVMFFAMLYNYTKGNVYTVRGNHDVGDFADFDFIIGLGFLKNPKYVDFVSEKGNTEIRFHFVNYGEEHNKLEIDEVASNVVLGHADYYIDGVTTWYSEKKGRVELKTLDNFNGVTMVFSGHIHNPSPEILYTTLPNGESIGLLYPGSCSRTAEKYKDCLYLSFDYDKENDVTNYAAELFGLLPLEEAFYDDSEFIGSEEEDEAQEAMKKKEEILNSIIQEIFDSRLATGDLFGQIDRVPADQDVKDLAKEYLRKAIDEV